MSSIAGGSGETLLQPRQKARKLADDWRLSNPQKTVEGVPPSLLSAEHIRKYIEETGLIWPFYVGDGRKSRLKTASYEGRIGDKAYKFDDTDNLEPVLVADRPLVIPANSIVFVECDLEFRLPREIALRFNLQIRHVHRGLLLGTGPLVDPGYWGKLCIPLHNLTDQPYEIPLDEGLIWVEFTKTTSLSEEGRVTLSGDKKHLEHWEIEKFLRKAAKPFDTSKPSIGIRSSIPEIARQTSLDAQKAADKADAAYEDAKSAKGDAEAARQSAFYVQTIGFVAALAVAVGVYTLWATFVGVIDNDLNAVSSRTDKLNDDMTEIAGEVNGITALSETYFQLQNQIVDLRTQIQEVELENSALRLQLNKFTEPPSTVDTGSPRETDAE